MARETGLSSAMVQRILELRTPDPNRGRHNPLRFGEIHQILQREFRNYEVSGEVDLEIRWMSRNRPPQAADSQASRGRAQPGSAAPQAPRRGGHRNPQMSFQQVHALSYRSAQPGPAFPQGGTQPAYGAPYPGPQSAPRGGPSGAPQYGSGSGQYGAPQSNSGYQFQSTSGPNQQASRVAFSNPPPGSGGVPPISSLFNVADRNGAPPPSQHPNWYGTGRGGSNGQS